MARIMCSAFTLLVQDCDFRAIHSTYAVSEFH